MVPAATSAPSRPVADPHRADHLELDATEVDAIARLLATATRNLSTDPTRDPDAGCHTAAALRWIAATLDALGAGTAGERPAGANEPGSPVGRPAGAEGVLAEAWALLLRAGSPLADDVVSAARELHHADRARQYGAVL